MTEWHADDAQLGAFRDGTLAAVAATSVEAHLIGCARCRATLAHLTDDVAPAERRDRMWAAIEDGIDRPSHDWRGHAWLQMTIGAPSLLWATIGLVLALVAIPVVASFGNTRAAVAVLFALAPLAPVLGAVLAYRADTDPAGELAAAAPLMSVRLVLLRAATVLVVAIPMGIAASVLLPVPFHLVIGWLLPGLALCAVVLACASRVDPTRLAAALALAWAVAVAAAFANTRNVALNTALEQLFVNQQLTQAAFGTVAVVAAIVAVTRRAEIRPWSTS
jgi:hypothetical protein